MFLLAKAISHFDQMTSFITAVCMLLLLLLSPSLPDLYAFIWLHLFTFILDVEWNVVVRFSVSLIASHEDTYKMASG